MKVITKQQMGNSTPVEIVWAHNADEVGVMLSVAQLLQHAKDEAPFSPRILEIRVEL